jgi:hypothetical protein
MEKMCFLSVLFSLYTLVNKAKYVNRIPTEQSPEYNYEDVDTRNPGQNCMVYGFTINEGEIKFRRDNPVTYSDGMKQRAHFNVALNGTDLGQHHYYGSLQ